MAEQYQQAANVAVVSTLGVGDRFLIVQSNGNLRAANSSTFISNLAVVVGNLTSNDKRTPANSSITVQRGTLFHDDDYLYVAVSNNTLKRLPFESF